MDHYFLNIKYLIKIKIDSYHWFIQTTYVYIYLFIFREGYTGASTPEFSPVLPASSVGVFDRIDQ